jgi:hypothetical protein
MPAASARRLYAWIAIVAMALAALAPTVSRALARPAGGSAGWIEVCTAAGMQALALAAPDAAASDGPAERAPAPGLSLDHCPLCLLGADRLGPPPGPSPRALPLGEPVAPPGGPAIRVRNRAPLAAPARGPPLNNLSPSVA